MGKSAVCAPIYMHDSEFVFETEDCLQVSKIVVQCFVSLILIC